VAEVAQTNWGDTVLSRRNRSQIKASGIPLDPEAITRAI
jgi:hypothetical protein